ncbi:MAG: T9SS type A sorting domain-containing protein [Bacteroidota bacterium]
MKKILLILALFLVMDTCYSQNGWVLQNSGTSCDILEITCVDNQNCWALARRNFDDIPRNDSLLILHTSNAGNSWEIQFYDSKEWGSVESIIYNSRGGIVKNIKLIDAYDKNNCVFSAANNMVYTTDRGNKWNIADSSSYLLTNINYIKGHTIWGIRYDSGDLLYSTNDGNSWSMGLSVDSTFLFNLFFLDSLYGWAFGYNYFKNSNDYVLINTTDGGKNWDKKIIKDYRLNDFVFSDNNIGWFCGELLDMKLFKIYGYLYKTTDNGSNFDGMFVDSSLAPYKIYFLDKNHGWFFKKRFTFNIYPIDEIPIIYKTTDAGKNWIIDDSFPKDSIYCIEFADSLNGWAVGTHGHIWHTTTGGFTGVNDVPKTNNNIEIYPNPATDHLKIQGAETGDKVQIFSVLGEKMSENIYNGSVDISGLQSGFYFVRIGNKYLKFVKM